MWSPNLRLVRYNFAVSSEISTRGMLYCLPNGPKFYTLELPWAENRPNISCIPLGPYEFVLNLKRNVIQFLEVPGREGIQIHTGNTLADTHGCILVGKNQREHAVYDSRLAFKELRNWIMEAKIRIGQIEIIKEPQCFSPIENSTPS